MSERHSELTRLRRERPKNRLLRASVGVLSLATLYAWTLGGLRPASLFEARRLANLRRFFTTEIVPFPLRDQPFRLSALWEWAATLFSTQGGPGLWRTFLISVLAITLAGCVALPLGALSSRVLATRRPFDPGSGATWVRRLVRAAVQWFCVLLRSIPEYVLAYLILAIFGPSVWPAVLALAIHNAGILGRLFGETVENLDPRAPQALAQLGAGRTQVALHGALPMATGRCLAYFFYRFETCVREATVLGMLGVVSLGYWIGEARASLYYDQLLFLTLLGTALVFAADRVSSVVRRRLHSG